MKRRQTMPSGFSLVELMLYASVASMVALAANRFMAVPRQMNTMMTTVSREQDGYHATVVPMDELKSAISSSIQWNLIDPSQTYPTYDPAVNSQFMPWFTINNPDVSPPVSYVCYAYRAADSTVVREVIDSTAPVHSPMTACAPVSGDGAVESILVRNVLPPGPANPLFQKDTAASDMIVMTVLTPSSSKTVSKIVRRAHLRS